MLCHKPVEIAIHRTVWQMYMLQVLELGQNPAFAASGCRPVTSSPKGNDFSRVLLAGRSWCQKVTLKNFCGDKYIKSGDENMLLATGFVYLFI